MRRWSLLVVASLGGGLASAPLAHADAKAEAGARAQAVEDKARDTAERARTAAAQALDETAAALDRARQAAESGKATATAHAKAAGEAIEEKKREAQTAVEQGLVAAEAAVDDAREAARSALLRAAEVIGGDVSQREAQRLARWQELRARLILQQRDSSRPAPALTEELAVHGKRTARLSRVRELASAANDAASVKRADALFEKENARHERRLTLLVGEMPDRGRRSDETRSTGAKP